MNYYKFKSAFTLVELLVVIAIIGILSAAVISVINPIEQQKKARDVVRKADLAKISTALEQYYADHNSYPTNSGDGTIPNDIDSYLRNNTPTETVSTYKYCYATTDGTNQSYVICSVSESMGDIADDAQSCSVLVGTGNQPEKYCVENPF